MQYSDLYKVYNAPVVGIFGFSDKLLYGGGDGGKALCNHNTFSNLFQFFEKNSLINKNEVKYNTLKE